MTFQLIKISILAVTFFSCSSPKTKTEEIMSAMKESTDKELIPTYQTVFLADSVKIDNVDLFVNNDSIDQESSLTILSNSCNELKADYNNYLLDSYQTLEFTSERLAYQDIANISRFLIWKVKSNDTTCFDKIFENAELILIRGDKATQTLLVVGFFEGIQNIGSWHKVDYHATFDKWLRAKSKKAWDELIKFWEDDKNK